jgi:hypothetical protein
MSLWNLRNHLLTLVGWSCLYAYFDLGFSPQIVPGGFRFLQVSHPVFYLPYTWPADLKAYIVKSPGLIPNMHNLRGGNVQRTV